MLENHKFCKFIKDDSESKLVFVHIFIKGFVNRELLFQVVDDIYV